MTDRLTINHCRKAGYCVTGIRKKCAAINVPFKKFVREGIAISEIEHIEDEGVQRCIAVARNSKQEGA